MPSGDWRNSRHQRGTGCGRYAGPRSPMSSGTPGGSQSDESVRNGGASTNRHTGTCCAGGQSVTFYPTRSTTGCACQPRHVRPGVTHAARYRTGLSELESGATARSRACWKRRIASIRWRVSAGTRRWIRCACRPRMHARGAAETVAYTGTEPCLTCAGLRSTAPGHVVYSVAADGDVDFRGQLVRSFGDRTLR